MRSKLGRLRNPDRNALHDAKIVVVIWTKKASESDWVKSEPGRANRDGKLINVRPADTAWRDVPSPCDQHHVNSLEDTDGILRSWGRRGEASRSAQRFRCTKSTSATTAAA